MYAQGHFSTEVCTPTPHIRLLTDRGRPVHQLHRPRARDPHCSQETRYSRGHIRHLATHAARSLDHGALVPSGPRSHRRARIDGDRFAPRREASARTHTVQDTGTWALGSDAGRRMRGTVGRHRSVARKQVQAEIRAPQQVTELARALERSRTFHKTHANEFAYTLATVQHHESDESSSLLSGSSSQQLIAYGSTPTHPPHRTRRVIFVVSCIFLGGILWVALPTLDPYVNPPFYSSRYFTNLFPPPIRQDRHLLHIPKSFSDLQDLNYLLKNTVTYIRSVSLSLTSSLTSCGYFRPVPVSRRPDPFRYLPAFKPFLYLALCIFLYLAALVLPLPCLACACVATGASLSFTRSLAEAWTR